MKLTCEACGDNLKFVTIDIAPNKAEGGAFVELKLSCPTCKRVQVGTLKTDTEFGEGDFEDPDADDPTWRQVELMCHKCRLVLARKDVFVNEEGHLLLSGVCPTCSKPTSAHVNPSEEDTSITLAVRTN